MEKPYDLVIVGAGSAGLTAAIYAQRAMLHTLVLEQGFAGGVITNSDLVENYPGIPSISGFDLGFKMVEHAKSLGATIINADITEMDVTEPIKKIITTKATYFTKTIIFATGAAPRFLGIEGESEFYGRGVSTCATCDGRFYKDKTAMVVGGGDVAVEDAIYLARICKKVILVHRRNALRAVKALQEKLFSLPNVEVIWDSVVTKISGTDLIESVTIENKLTQQFSTLPIDGLFIAVGMDPASQLLKGKVEMDSAGWIKTDEHCETSVKGVFAAGDVRIKPLRQVITAASDGAVAVFACEKYL